MRYVPLEDIWPAHGLVSVVVALLRDAGFDPMIECDPRGWLHFRGWPLGSFGPVTIWIPEEEYEDARTFMGAPFELEAPDQEEPPRGFWATISAHRRLILAIWLLGSAMLAL